MTPDSRQAQPVGSVVDDAPAERPGPVTLEGRFCRVEKLDPARHAAALWRAVEGDDRLWTYMSSGPFPDGEAFSRWLEERATLLDPYYYAVVDRTSEEALGVATLMEIRPAMRVIEVGNIFYGGKLQRTPAATEAQYLLACYVFDELRYRRYEWKCNAMNEPSRRAARRLGFTFEGIFRQHMIIKGRNRDTAWFAMTDNDWPGVKRAFERWLAPENFDSAGRQHESLSSMSDAEGGAPR